MYPTTVLMCPPDYFGVDYSINPWMEGQIGLASPERAHRQWSDFYQALKRVADVHLLDPKPNLPDLVFTANAGLVHRGRFLPSRFRHAERRGEEPCFRNWFQQHGFEVRRMPQDICFEGAGDALLQPGTDILWVAWGFRTDIGSHAVVREEFPGLRVVSLRLRDPRFYHLDTCFCPLLDGQVMYFPGAFDAPSLAAIEQNTLPENRIAVEEEDALHFACNAVLIDRVLFMNRAGKNLQHRLERLGYTVAVQPVPEFLKAGGANKCLTLPVRHGGEAVFSWKSAA